MKRMELRAGLSRALSLLLSALSLLCCLSPSVTTAVSSLSPSDVEACNWTFGDLLGYWGYESEINVWPCPPGCMEAPNIYNETQPIQVWGSYPYHPDSSICHSAIHCGLISNSSGGIVRTARFHRQTWNNDDSQTTFPFTSLSGTLSNGVQSWDVPPEAIPSIPADRFAWSAIPTPAVGLYIAQRRSAPFSPRSNHLHTSIHFTAEQPERGYDEPTFIVDVIIGGRQGSQRYNDVWLAVRNSDLSDEEDWEWRYVGLAPFSPRSDMLSWWDEHDYHWNREDGVFRLYIIGGQVGSQCNLEELGVCSDEVWVAELREKVNATMEVIWTWNHTDPATVPRLPFPARCGASLVGWTAVKPWRGDWPALPAEQVKAIIGGQLNYSDPKCESPPEMAEDHWYTFGPPDSSIVAPYNASHGWFKDPRPSVISPRRSQQMDDTFVHLLSTNEFYPVLRAYTLVGGIRYLDLRFDVELNRSVLLKAEIFADVWECNFDIRVDDSTHVSLCNWGGPMEGTYHDPPSWPADSTPLPTAGGASVRAGTGLGGIRIGGQTSRAAIHAWENTPPIIENSQQVDISQVTVNTTVILSPHRDWAAQCQSELMIARRNLSLSQILGEEELNAKDSPYTLGSDYVISHIKMDPGLVPFLLRPSTVHYQPWAWADKPEDATWYNPQVASSENTSKPLFNFRLRRIGHGMSLHSFYGLVGTQVISGGRSGNSYSNDWIRMAISRCASPDDVVYYNALGPVVLLETLVDPVYGNNQSQGENDGPAQLPGGIALVACASGYHWSPPTREKKAKLYCAPNGMWMNFDSLTVSRCVPATLNCVFPEVDLGFNRCQAPVPYIESISVFVDFEVVTQVDNLTVADVPVSGGGVLVIRGGFFSLPITVLINGQKCELPRLLSLNSTQCAADEYAPEIQCFVPQVFGLHMGITVISSSHEIIETTTSKAATLSSMPPVIEWLTSEDCDDSMDPLILNNCPNDRAFNMSVVFLGVSVSSTSDVLLRLSTSELLHCFDRAELPYADYLQGMTCTIQPHVGEFLPLRMMQAGLMQESLKATSVSFAPCQPGFRVNPDSSYNRSAGLPCVPCDVGHSTNGGQGQFDCKPCSPGSFANVTGLANCYQCEPGYSMPSLGARACNNCSINSWSRLSGRSSCDACDMGTYIHYENRSASGEIAATCQACPPLAFCHASGNISALGGAYLLLDQRAALVHSVPCSPSACRPVLDDDRHIRPECSQATPQLLTTSSLPVINCCASGRHPAYDPSNSALSSTGGVNALCAMCLPGHSEVNGRCIPCDAIQWAPFILMLTAAFILVYILHRTPQDISGSARLAISSYFIQTSLMFLSSESMPQPLSLLNMNFLGDRQSSYGDDIGSQDGDFYVGMCIVPLSAIGRIQMQLLSPVIAVALLCLIGGLELTFRFCVKWRPSNRLGKAYLLCCVPRALDGTETAAVEESKGIVQPHILEDELIAPVERMWPHYQRTLVRLVQLSYSTISFVALSYFRVRSLGALGNRLVLYPSIDTSSAEYSTLLPTMCILLAVVVLALPLSQTLFLLYEHRRGAIAQVKEIADGGIPLSNREALLLQLCSMYKVDYWWHGSFILLRRLVLIVLLVVMDDSSVWLWANAVNFSLLTIHLRFSPFHRDEDNTLESLVLASLALQTTLLSAFPPPYMSVSLCLTFITLTLGPLLPVVLSVLRGSCEQCRSWKTRSRFKDLHEALLQNWEADSTEVT